MLHHLKGWNFYPSFKKKKLQLVIYFNASVLLSLEWSCLYSKKGDFSLVTSPGTKKQLYENEFNLQFIIRAVLSVFIAGPLFFSFSVGKGGKGGFIKCVRLLLAYYLERKSVLGPYRSTVPDAATGHNWLHVAALRLEMHPFCIMSSQSIKCKLDFKDSTKKKCKRSP